MCSFSTLCLIYMIRPHPRYPLFPYTTLFRSRGQDPADLLGREPKSAFGRRRFHSRHGRRDIRAAEIKRPIGGPRSEEHTSELQSRLHLVCRLLLEKKKKNNIIQKE